jgi:N-acetylmuramoyl-L-alanine amidase
LYEQDLTFCIGILLAELLQADGRFEVCLSRPDESTVLGSDTASSLAARVNGAAEFQADYFVSLHVNAYTEDTANGIEVFVPAGDRESYAFGHAMLRGMVEATSLNNRGMKQSDELYVLKNTEMPAVLLEMGFISNAEDAALLSEHPELFAQGIYHGIVEYFEPADTARPSVRLWMIAASTALVVGVVALLWRTKRTRSEDQAFPT